MKILSPDKIRASDQYTIQHEPITSIDLMERASIQVVNWITQRFDNTHPICVVCGMGNNGGDGLAIARLLRDLNYEVEVNVIALLKTGSEDFETNLSRFSDKDIPIYYHNHVTDQIKGADKKIFIDAIFGSGLNKEISGWIADSVQHINQLKGIKISVDIPSGLFSEEPRKGVIFKADYTLCFQVPKLALLLPDNFEVVGEWHILDIQLHSDYLKEVETDQHYVDDYFIHTMTKPRIKHGHKGTFGHSLMIGGSKGMIGASILSSKAALKSGCGLITAFIPECGYNAIQSSFPEAMALCSENYNFHEQLSIQLENYDSIGIGPGLGQNQATQKFVFDAITAFQGKLVIDADAINAISKNVSILKQIKGQAILTPHPKELERLIGKWENDYQKLELAKDFCQEYKVILIIKGQHSCIIHPNRHTYFNSTGNEGMATGGSGDVLTGIITGLLAQGYAPLEAAIYGTYWHGLAGDHAKDQLTSQCMIASDIIKHLSSANQEILNYNFN